MKIRHVLIAVIAVVVVVVVNAAFGGISNALKRSDYNHCRVTTHYTVSECKSLTQYEGE